MQIESLDGLEVVIKITERCNINCSYCYMFNRGNDDYLAHPSYMPAEVVDDIVVFLLDGIKSLSIRNVGIVFHGGEPLMLKKWRFIEICEKLMQALSTHAKINLSIQTNAMLIDDEWIDIFEKYKISVGVSLDGPEAYHDLARVDHQNKGTHAATIKGVQLLQTAYHAKRIRALGAICVINPSFYARVIYRHFVDDLGLQLLSFNLPMETLDTISANGGHEITHFLAELFEEWIKDDNPRVKIRIFDNMFRFFAGDRFYQNILPNFATQHILVVIASNGDISENDDFKLIGFGQNAGNVRNTSMIEFANSPLRQYIGDIYQRLAPVCQTCDWQNYCLAGVPHGLITSRYSKERGFNNPSAYCETFKTLFEMGASYLLRNGVSIDVITASLDPTPYQLQRATPLTAPPASFFTKIIPIHTQ
jgi:uncharacterized protein